MQDRWRMGMTIAVAFLAGCVVTLLYMQRELTHVKSELAALRAERGRGQELIAAVSSARERAAKISSASNLKQIGYGCHLWAADHDEDFAPSLEALYERHYMGDRKTLECPARPGETGYVYVHAVKVTDEPWLLLAYEKDGCFPDGRNVLLVSGSVQWKSNADFLVALKRTRELLRSK